MFSSFYGVLFYYVTDLFSSAHYGLLLLNYWTLLQSTIFVPFSWLVSSTKGHVNLQSRFCFLLTRTLYDSWWVPENASLAKNEINQNARGMTSTTNGMKWNSAAVIALFSRFFPAFSKTFSLKLNDFLVFLVARRFLVAFSSIFIIMIFSSKKIKNI